MRLSLLRICVCILCSVVFVLVCVRAWGVFSQQSGEARYSELDPPVKCCWCLGTQYHCEPSSLLLDHTPAHSLTFLCSLFNLAHSYRLVMSIQRSSLTPAR